MTNLRMALCSTLLGLTALVSTFTGCGPGSNGTDVTAVEIDGVLAGTVTDFKLDTAADAATKTHPVSFQVDSHSGPALLDWMEQELASDAWVDSGATVRRHSISIVTLTDDGSEIARVTLGKAQLDVFTLSPLSNDAVSPLQAQLKIYPEKTESTFELVAATPASAALAAARIKTQGDFNLAHKFSVEIEGISVNGVQAVSGMEHTHDTVEYKDGEDQTTRMRPGKQKPGQIVVTREWSGDDQTFAKWRDEVHSAGGASRRSMTVKFTTDAGQKSQIDLFNCWPTAYEAPSDAARNSGHATEILTLEFASVDFGINQQGIERLTSAQADFAAKLTDVRDQLTILGLDADTQKKIVPKLATQIMVANQTSFGLIATGVVAADLNLAGLLDRAAAEGSSPLVTVTLINQLLAVAQTSQLDPQLDRASSRFLFEELGDEADHLRCVQALPTYFDANMGYACDLLHGLATGQRGFYSAPQIGDEVVAIGKQEGSDLKDLSAKINAFYDAAASAAKGTALPQSITDLKAVSDRLLAHELTHVVQQAQGLVASIKADADSAQLLYANDRDAINPLYHGGDGSTVPAVYQHNQTDLELIRTRAFEVSLPGLASLALISPDDRTALHAAIVAAVSDPFVATGDAATAQAAAAASAAEDTFSTASAARKSKTYEKMKDADTLSKKIKTYHDMSSKIIGNIRA